MAKRRNQYAFPDQCPAQIDSMDQSRFWRRLDELSGAEEESEDRKKAIDHLKASIRKVTERAKWISTQVCRFMPQYTLHEERHFLNVLSIMDALVPEGVVRRFGPLDCALPILAAYIHDLGMALSQDEYNRMHDKSTEQGKHFASYRARFDEELRQLQRWKKRRDELAGRADAESQQESSSVRERIESIEGHILASYVRYTHTEDDQVRRLRVWLEAIKQETGDDNVFRYGVSGKDYQRELALIGISHGCSAPWLRRQLIDGGEDDSFYQPISTGGAINLAFPGLLLRLADVMDFDASRAPRILFKHFGIENDQSVLEWKKHMSIIGWRLGVDPAGKQQPGLLYSAECEHPVHEKAIREFKTWIDTELSAVRIELDAQCRQLPAAAQGRYDLHLPSQTRLDIRPARDPLTDQLKYVYHDLQFHLDQNEIQKLLMGESLYGDPFLCIRELIQNALDALELRELRLKMKQKGEGREPVDGELVRPGWVREPDGREEELHVTLDWGTDEKTGQQWLRVTDNGVGMTDEVIKNYFTQIGKSYYRSSEFNQERSVMMALGERISPISNFGIGILSCFMICDRIEVGTFAGALSDRDRTALEIHISGPGSLFWLKAGNSDTQGTSVKVFLKRGFKIKQSTADLHEQLREHFRYGSESDKLERYGNEDVDRMFQFAIAEEKGETVVDPALVAASCAVWPLYPIEINYPCGHRLSINDRFHPDVLAPIEKDALVSIAAEWGCSEELLGEPSWQFFDWQDDEPDVGTGTRIRLWYPSTHSTSPLDRKTAFAPIESERTCRLDELASFVESQLEGQAWSSGEWAPRVRFLLKGMHVRGNVICDEILRCAPLVGCRIWIDLRGTAGPQLTVDRRTMFQRQNRTEWRRIGNAVFERFQNDLLASQSTILQLKNLLSLFVFPGNLRIAQISETNGVNILDFGTASWLKGLEAQTTASQWKSARLLQLRARYRALITELSSIWDIDDYQDSERMGGLNSDLESELIQRFTSLYDIDPDLDLHQQSGNAQEDALALRRDKPAQVSIGHFIVSSTLDPRK